MGIKELKTEIQKALDKIPENILEDILSYLKEMQGKSRTEIDKVRHLKKILTEDRELLKKLAQ